MTMGNNNPYNTRCVLYIKAGAASMAGAWFIRFTAFSLPGQFAPRGESDNRTLANSLPGTFLPGLFAPWPPRSLEPSLPGPFAPWPSRYSINRIIFAALAYSLYRPMIWR